MEHILNLEQVKKYYGGNSGNITKAVDGISMYVDKGEFVAIMGASGSGKTTLLNCISTIDTVTSGHITVNNQDITKIKDKDFADFRRENLGFIFQDFNLLDTLTIGENISLSLVINKQNPTDIEKRVHAIADKLGIRDILSKFPYEVSGGQKQRCACARALINEAKESESLSEEEFEKKYGSEFEVCKTLGEHGWVVSGHSNPRYIKNWYKALIEGEPDKIACFFEEDDDRVIKNIMDTLERKYNDPVNRNYYSRGIKAFQDNDYMTCAMYLVGLLEARVNALVQFPPRTKYREKFSDKGFVDVKQEQFAESSSFFTKRYYFLDVYPSLIAFLNRLFVDGKYTFENGVEPPYINRNWLLHGKCCREIERFECIQLLNALETIENVLGNENEIESQ